MDRRVYYIANARMPNEKAHGIQLAKMCEAFIKQGIDLELILPNKKNKNKSSIHKFYGLRDKIKIKKLPIVNIFPKTRFGFNLSALTFAYSYFFYLLFKRLKREKFIIYTIDLDQFSFFMIPLLGVSYFFETHALKKRSFAHTFFFRKVKGVIAINKIIKKDLIKHFGFDYSKILVFPNGIDLTMFKIFPQKQAKEHLDLPAEKRTIVYIGRAYNWKGMDIIIDVANHLPETYVFYIVGTTETQLKDVTGKDRIPENIVCVGHRDYKEIPLWESAADVLLQLGIKTNDYSYRQTSPMKLFEYMAVMRPIVASKTPAIEEIVNKNEVSFYEPDNPLSLTESIQKVVKEKNQADEKTKNARAKVEKFTWEKRAYAIKEFIIKSA